MIVNGDYDLINDESYINIEPNVAELESILIIKNPKYKVSFGGKNNIGKLLGFPAVIYDAGYHESPKIVDISPITSILVNVDIVNGSYLNGSRAPIIYTFAPAVGPGRKIIESPTIPMYLPVSQSELSSVRIWLTDQNQRPVNNRKETLTIRLSMREIKKRNTKRSFAKAIKKLNENE